MIINLDGNFIDYLENKEIMELPSIYKFVAMALGSCRLTPAQQPAFFQITPEIQKKLGLWSEILGEKKEIDLDEIDLELFKKFIENHEVMVAYQKRQINTLIKESEKISEERKKINNFIKEAHEIYEQDISKEKQLKLNADII